MNTERLQAIPGQLRDVAREMSEQGHPWIGSKIMDMAQQIDEYVALNAAGQSTAEVARLRAVIQNAIPHQSNFEVLRWLREALSYGMPIYQNVNNRRIDVEPE